MEISDLKKVKSTGPGWERIVTPLIAYCLANGVEILQIKEKFAGLSFYYRADPERWTGGDENLDKLINAAEIEADKTCEWCGGEGKRIIYPNGNYGWLKTLCPEHTEKWRAGERWWIDKDGKHV
jgi:hypothetical protein